MKILSLLFLSSLSCFGASLVGVPLSTPGVNTSGLYTNVPISWVFNTNSFTVSGGTPASVNGTYVFSRQVPGISVPFIQIWTNGTFGIVAGDVDEFDTLVITNGDGVSIIYNTSLNNPAHTGSPIWVLGDGGVYNTPPTSPVFQTIYQTVRFDQAKTNQSYNFHQYVAATNMIRAKHTMIAGNFMGQTYYSPGGAYLLEYLRDADMLFNGLPYFFANNEISNCAWRACSSVVNNQLQDAINSDSSPLAHYDLDGPTQVIDIIYQHYKRTQSLFLMTNFQATISNCFQQFTYSNSCIYLTGVQRGWGFHDGMQSVGIETALNVFYYRALKERGEMLNAAGQYFNASNDFFTASIVSSNIEFHCFDSTTSMFKIASGVNTQSDAPGTALAICFGACRPAIAHQAIDGLISRLPGGSLWPTEAISYKGAILMSRTNSFPLSACTDTAGQGDNGGAWPAFTGWVSAAVAQHDPTIAFNLLGELESKYIADGPNGWAQEWFSNGHSNPQYYAASGANPAEFYVSISDRHLIHPYVLYGGLGAATTNTAPGSSTPVKWTDVWIQGAKYKVGLCQ